jgi:hypothetical protein
MFKRARWMATGAIGGAVATVATTRKVKRQVEALAPTHVAKRAVRGVSKTADNVAGRARDGRAEARRVEAQLRDRWQGDVRR